ncbi:MAG: FHA domain-containing protein [Acidimicrobiales bacterium]
MSDQLFIVLRVCLLALVYLVFLRVLRAVWVELRAESAVAAGPAPGSSPAPRPAPPRRSPAPAPSPAPSATTAASGTARLVVVAPGALAGRSFTLEGETTIGRGAGCGVSIDDAHVSKLHARLSPDGGGWTLEDLGSTNGTVLDGEMITRPTPIRRGGRITIGELVLELA